MIVAELMPVATAEKKGLMSPSLFKLLPKYAMFTSKEAIYQILLIPENSNYLLEVSTESVEGVMNVAHISIWRHANSGNILKGKINNLTGNINAYIGNNTLFVKVSYYTYVSAREIMKGANPNIKIVDIDESTLTKLQ